MPKLDNELRIVLLVSLVLASFYPLVNLAVYLNRGDLAFTQGEHDEGVIQTGYVTAAFNNSYPFDPVGTSSLYTPVLSYNLYAFTQGLNFLSINPYAYNYLLVFIFSFAYLVSLYFVVRLLGGEKDALNVFLLVCFIPSLAGLGFVLGSNDQAPLACISPNLERERLLRSDPTEQEFNSQRVDGVVARWNDLNCFSGNDIRLLRSPILIRPAQQFVEH